MQHDVDYSACKNKPDPLKCKHEADRRMVKSLDAIPWNQRQWGHALARNVIGLGIKKKGKILRGSIIAIRVIGRDSLQ